MNFDLLIRHGVLVDGTGTPAQEADVGIVGDHIEPCPLSRESGGRYVDGAKQSHISPTAAQY